MRREELSAALDTNGRARTRRRVGYHHSGRRRGVAGFRPNGRLPIDHDRLADFCRRWQIAELSLFGSVLRDDFHLASDVDVLVSFEPTAEWGVLDHIAMQEELTGLFGRRVDLVSRRAVERSPNHLRRDAILSNIERLT